MSYKRLTDAEIEAGLKLAEFATSTPSEYYIAVQRDFNTAAREGWPRALREVQRLQAENQALREESSAAQEDSAKIEILKEYFRTLHAQEGSKQIGLGRNL